MGRGVVDVDDEPEVSVAENREDEPGWDKPSPCCTAAIEAIELGREGEECREAMKNVNVAASKTLRDQGSFVMFFVACAWRSSESGSLEPDYPDSLRL